MLILLLAVLALSASIESIELLDRVVSVYLWSVDLRRETARKLTDEEV